MQRIEQDGQGVIKMLKNEELKLLLWYYYEDESYKMKGAKKIDYQTAVIARCQAERGVRLESGVVENEEVVETMVVDRTGI